LEYDKWNTSLEYLKKSILAWWSNESMELLIEKAWKKITEPISFVDSGYGIKILGKPLMPFLPSGSTYTGIEVRDLFLRKYNHLLSFIKILEVL